MKLDQFLKWKGLVATGGEAKYLINAELVRVNGITETRRGRKLNIGDSVFISNNEYIVSETGTKGPKLSGSDVSRIERA